MRSRFDLSVERPQSNRNFILLCSLSSTVDEHNRFNSRKSRVHRRKVYSQKFTRGKPLSVRVESCRRWTSTSFGPPRRLAAAPGSPQVVRRKTIARQWPPAPTLRTPAPAPAAAEPRQERASSYVRLLPFYKIHAAVHPASIGALIKRERPTVTAWPARV